ncbi:hypothetical protein ACJJTC_001518 [Scirpophaga incertulas]
MFLVYINLVWVLGTIAAQNTNQLFELSIAHFNDFHAHYEEVNPSGTVCQPEVEPCMGGFARLYTAVKQVRADDPEALLLNAGDTFQGTIWYNFMRWNVSQHFMNLLPHTAHALGNHEFDHGVEGLLPYLENLKAPMLGANVNTTYEPRLTNFIRNHIVVTVKNRKVGIIGVLLRQFSAPIGRLIIEDEEAAINREAAILKSQGIDIIIVMSHVGFNRDMYLASRISTDVDIIVGAHSHSLLYTGQPPSGHTAQGKYPTVVSRGESSILVVQASCYTRYLGHIKLFIDDDGVVKRWEGKPIYLGTSIIPDPEMVMELEPWKQEVDAVGKEVLGISKVTLNRSWCSEGECNLGSWACDGFLESVMDQATGTAWHHAHICLINTGGLRVQIDPGEVTTESLLMAMPFENYVQMYDLKGEYLLQALEHSAGSSQTTPGHFRSGRMLQVGGLRVVYNASQPVGSRVLSTRIRCIDCDVPRYYPLDTNATYRVISQSYIGDGGGGYTMLSEHRENLQTLQVDYVVLQQYLRKQQVIMKDLDGRIQVVW